MDSEGDHSPPSKSKPLGCPKQGKEEEQGEKRREKRGGRRGRGGGGERGECAQKSKEDAKLIHRDHLH